MKNSYILLAIDVIISLFYSFVVENSFILSFINSFFIVGMAYFLFGILCYVWEGGFFNVTLFAFNKIGQQIQKKRGILENEPNIQVEDYVNKKNEFFLTNNLLISGGAISVFCIVVSFMYI